MENIKIATAQFEHKSGDKNYNLGIIEKLSEKAAADGARAIAFHGRQSSEPRAYWLRAPVGR